MTSPSDDRAHSRADATALLAEMRRSVETAADQLERMAAELTDCRARLDRLETVVDTLLEIIDLAVVVVDGDRHVLGLSRAAAERFGDIAIGKPISSVVHDSLDDAVRVHELPDDAALLVLPGPER
jgi:PAS domain-containing protein